MVVWELAAFDNMPFGSMSPIRVAHEVAYNGLTLQLPPEAATGCPVGVAALMSACMRAEPSERPGFEALVATLNSIAPPVPAPPPPVPVPDDETRDRPFCRMDSVAPVVGRGVVATRHDCCAEGCTESLSALGAGPHVAEGASAESCGGGGREVWTVQ